MKFAAMSRFDAERYSPRGSHVWIQILDPLPVQNVQSDFPDLTHTKPEAVLRMRFFHGWGDLSRRDARRILDFVEKWAHVGSCCIHCFHGKNRSVAVAAALDLIVNGSRRWDRRGYSPIIYSGILSGWIIRNRRQGSA